MLISDTFAALGQEQDLFQRFDAEDVPNLAELNEFAVDDAYAGPAYTYQLNGILYRSDEITSEEAAEWSLFEDPALAGKVALPDISATAGQLTVSGIAEAYGSGPYDVDTAFSVMGDWAPDVLQFYTSTTEVSNLISQARSSPCRRSSASSRRWSPPASRSAGSRRTRAATWRPTG